MTVRRSEGARATFHAEPLERRVLLAGNVVVFTARNGDVYIVGDARANGIEMDRFGDFTVRGVDAGGAPTRVNGVPNGEVNFTASGGADIKIRTGAGADVIGVGVNSDFVDPPDDLEIDSGLGDDIVTITGDTNVGDDLEIRSGFGADAIDVLNADVSDNLIVSGGFGADTVRLLFDRVGDDTAVDTGPGADRLLVEGSSFSDAFVARTGVGDDFAELCQSTFRGRVDVHLGGGNDGLCVGGHNAPSVFESTRVRFHGGAGNNDRYVIEFSTFAGEPVIDTLIDGFEFSVDDCTHLGGTCIPTPP